MQVVRIYTGEDGESHIEDMELPFEQMGHALRTAMQEAIGVQFSSLKPTQLVDFHTAPRRQYVITLQGQVEIGLGDGTRRIFNVGESNSAKTSPGAATPPAASATLTASACRSRWPTRRRAAD